MIYYCIFILSMLALHYRTVSVHKKKIRFLIESSGGHVIYIKNKTGISRRPRYKVVYQTKTHKVECVAIRDSAIPGRSDFSWEKSCRDEFLLETERRIDFYWEKNAQVEVVRKSTYRLSGYRPRFIHFKFPDGIEKAFEVWLPQYEVIQENETGTLFYRENSPAENVEDRLFVRFKKHCPSKD